MRVYAYISATVSVHNEESYLQIRILRVLGFQCYQDIIMYFFSGSAAQHGLWPPCSQGFLITHNDVPQSVGLLRTSDRLVAETST
jgi:hypothetical protein